MELYELQLAYHYRLNGNTYVALPDTERAEEPRLYLQMVDDETLRPFGFSFGYVLNRDNHSLSFFDPDSWEGGNYVGSGPGGDPSPFTLADVITVVARGTQAEYPSESPPEGRNDNDNDVLRGT